MSNVDTNKLRAGIIELRCVYGDAEVDRGLAMQVRAIDLAALLDDNEQLRDLTARQDRTIVGLTQAQERHNASNREALRQRDAARANARILAHAYRHDSRPPERAVDESLAYPAIPLTAERGQAADVTEQLELATDAIEYALERVCRDPEFAYHMLFTETLNRLIRASARISGRDPVLVRKEIMKRTAELPQSRCAADKEFIDGGGAHGDI